MRKMQWIVFFVLVVAFAGRVFADEMNAQALLRAKGCNGCHQETTLAIGPSYREISRHFRGISTARETLARVVMQGTSEGDGNYRWGTIRMPPPDRRVPVTRAEAEVLVDYILSVK